jgi:large subunit ribosomal protein L15e
MKDSRGLAEASMYKYVAETWQAELKEKTPAIKDRLISWRKGPRVIRVAHPTRLDRARALGFKAKQGFVVVRVRISRGGIRIKRPVAGRRSKHLGVLRIKGQLLEAGVVAGRVKERYPNMKFLGSYFLAEDGRYRWFEAVLVDTYHPSIKADKELRQLTRT